ncbi:hypothetical protein T10_1474 [Trichinella papuae]|uniref:Uncharacterized protein n=1 Tax=Trichinella papuae TaxID=268474 RepID=A0A0V1MJM0_9BILA|nr:hypothetical protein T10_1474 [Trichinella papuae]
MNWQIDDNMQHTRKRVFISIIVCKVPSMLVCQFMLCLCKLIAFVSSLPPATELSSSVQIKCRALSIID